MIFLRMVVAASVAGLSTFGCEEDEELFNSATRLYFHNQLTQVTGGSADDVVVDLFVDDQNTPLVSDSGYTTSGSVSSETVSLDDDSESIQFDVRGNSSGSTLVDGPVTRTLNEGDRYTVVLMGDTTLDNRQLKTYRYQDASVASGQARVRFINTLSRLEGDELSVSQGDGSAPLAVDLGYGDSSRYLTLGSGTLTVNVNNQSQGVLIRQVSCSVSGGRSYDAIIASTRFDSDDDQISLYCQPL